jgi:putative membrane protein
MADQTISLEPKFEENKKIKAAIWIFTVVVFGLVATLPKVREMIGVDNPPAFTKALPTVNAIVNSICFIVLITSLVMIKKKNVIAHMRLNTFALVLSVIFLLTYVLYHITNPDTPYEGDYKGIYYFILFSHILTSGISLPFILFSYYRAYTGNVAGHRKLVKIAYPIWLYVALTGPLVYVFLSPFYN